jgi:serralysin
MRTDKREFRRPRRNFLRGAACMTGGLILPLPAAFAKAPSGKTDSPFVPAGYRLAFGDDFDDGDVSRINENATGARPGAPAWRSRYRHERKDIINDEKQIYVDPAYGGQSAPALGLQPFSIANGILTITAEPTPAKHVEALMGKRYTSGCITTELTHWQTYGYFEMRARLPRGKGFWPAFWLLPKRTAWPPEIDIFEGSGARPRNVHVGALDPTLKDVSTGDWVDAGVDTTSDFHIYAAEWTHEKIAFFVDGKQVFQLAPHGIHEDMYLLANLALGSKDAGWIPDPDDSTPFPGKFEIDYIRAYSKA